MGYSIALKTNSKKQSEEILSFINTLDTVSKVRNDKNYIHHDFNWSSGNGLAYIEEKDHIGVNMGNFDDFESVYFYSLMYKIGLKFNLFEKINNINCVFLNYDDTENFCLAKENPYNKEDSKYLSHVSLNQDGIKISKKKIAFITVEKLTKKENNNILEFINNII